MRSSGGDAPSRSTTRWPTASIPALVDSEGATALHVIGSSADNVNPEMVRALVRAGASVNAPLPSGTQPIELAARMILPATVAAMVELGADAGRGLDSLMAWWAVGCGVQRVPRRRRSSR